MCNTSTTIMVEPKNITLEVQRADEPKTVTLEVKRALSPLPGPRKLTIEEYRARQKPKMLTPVSLPIRKRGGRGQKLRKLRRELYLQLNLTTDEIKRSQYIRQLEALKGLKKIL